ncbi:hypothetical protein SEA_GHOBES_30 [Gordonia phage Ghobes]|uniref:Uncharacterized protein n=1 Tax=Gordonia phage Ghobes TaxID=1887647 RepID=A0A1B3B060_9CAUD|nr:hypothetical protein KCH37_gp30 [Gordonia phage Ghobes]AOE44382.1 hypothetical protein SEA_GHOBES_30 [Gordonia phage Ghobes]
MPKLTKKVAAQVDKSEAASGSYLLPEGRYAAQLKSVVQKDGNEYPYWVWEFENLHDADGNKQAGRQWNNTSLSPKSLGFLKATFEAFGYTSDSDTDELVGEWVVLYLVQEPISRGPKAGQLRNQVQSLSEFNPDEWDFDPESVGSSAAKEDSDDEY